MADILRRLTLIFVQKIYATDALPFSNGPNVTYRVHMCYGRNIKNITCKIYNSIN
jgi:hypothetical protein